MNQVFITGLDAWARRAMVMLALVTSVGLLLISRGSHSGWPGLQSSVQLTLLNTLLTAVPMLIALLLNKAKDRVPWIAGIAYAIVLVPLAIHTAHVAGKEMLDRREPRFFYYGLVIAIASFILVPFIQAARSGRSVFHYPALFEFSWSNALALAITTVFTSACWLILLLWQELFELIGISIFRELFKQAEFAYPATGLFVGIGLVLGRTQANAVRTLLNICLTLGQMLFPLIAVVALLFFGALVFNSLAPLWQTRHAAALLLTLVFVVISLLNAVYQDGLRPDTYKAPLRWLTNATLLILPIFVGIAAYALWLRVAQHGWTEQRLWAALVTAVAALHAFSYAVSVLWRKQAWLSLVGPANSRIAFASILTLLLSQSALLDFRSIAVGNQISRALSAGSDPTRLDLHYLRFESGKAGNDSLKVLKADPRIAGNADLLASIDKILLQTHEYQPSLDRTEAVNADTFTIVPAGTTIPEGLLAAINNPQPGDFGGGAIRCAKGPDRCLLLLTNLGPDGTPAWIEINTEGIGNYPLVYSEDANGWKYRGVLMPVTDKLDSKKLQQALGNGNYKAEPPQWKDLVIDGNTRYRFQPRR